jgi:hypothetical protein
MDMQFNVGQGVRFGIDVKKNVSFGFDIGGYSPAPTPPTPPTPSTDYAPFTLHPVIIQGTSGTFFAPTETPYGVADKLVTYNNGVAYYTTGNNGVNTPGPLTIPDPRVTRIPAKSLAIIMYRSAKTFTASGYTLLADSQVMSTSEIPMQQLSVYQKSILPTETAGSLTVSQTDNARLDIINAIISGNNVTLTLVDNALVASVPYTPPAKTAKRRLYIVSSINAKNSDTKTPYFNLGVSGLGMRSDGFNRLKVYYDYDPTVNLTPTLTYSNDYTANSLALMTFDVDGTF